MQVTGFRFQAGGYACVLACYSQISKQIRMKKLSILLAIIAMPLLSYAAGDTIRIEADALTPIHYEEFGEWCFEFNSAYPINGLKYKLKFQYVSKEMTGTFTKADLAGGKYNQMLQPLNAETNESLPYVYYDSVLLIVQHKELLSGIKYLTLDATVHGSDGNIYVVHGENDVLMPRDTIQYTFPVTDLHIIGDTAFQVVGRLQDGTEAAVQINNPAIVGNYSLADLVPTGTYISFANGKRVSLLIDEEGVASMLSKDTVSMQGKRYDFRFRFLATDTVLYELRMTHDLPAPKDTMDITINNLTIDDSNLTYSRTLILDGYNNAYEVLMEIVAFSITGTFTSPDAVVGITKHTAKGDSYTYSLYSKVVIKEVNDSTIVQAEVIATDSIYYNITMRQLAAPVKDTISLAFDTRAYIVPNSNGGSYQVYNMNDEYLISVAFISYKLEGEFTTRNGDIVSQYTYLHHAVRRPSGKMDTVIAKIADTECVVRQTVDSILVDATIKDYDGTLYKVSFWYAVPVPKDTIDVTISKAAFYNALEYGSFQLYGMSDDSTYLVSLCPNADTLAGTWTMDGMFKHSDFYDVYTFMYKLDANQVAAEVIYLLEGDATSVIRNDTVFMDARFIGSDDKMYNLHFIADTHTRLQYDAEEGEIDHTFSADDKVLFITKYFERDGEVFLTLLGKYTNNQYPFAQIGFFVEEIDATYYLPEGNYPIDYTYQPGTVEASSGVLYYQAHPSNFGYLDNEGYLIEPFWFFFSGNVNIQHTANGIRMEVNALNSYDRPIHLVYEGMPVMDAIEEVNAEKNSPAKKYLQNGELRIRRADGNVFTILGQEVTD